MKDWSSYELPAYRLAHVIKLWCELPDDYSLKVDRHTQEPLPDPQYPLVANRTAILVDAIKTGKLAKETWEFPVTIPNRRHPKMVSRWVVKHDALKLWFEVYRPYERPAFLFWREDASDTPDTPASEWSQFTHDTKLLKACRWVIKTYWEGRAEVDWPTKDFILEKLEGIYPVRLSKGEMEAIDLVTRHDAKRRSGG